MGWSEWKNFGGIDNAYILASGFSSVGGLSTTTTFSIPSDADYSCYVASVSMSPAGWWLSKVDINTDYLVKDVVKEKSGNVAGGVIVFKADKSTNITITGTFTQNEPGNNFGYSIIGIK